MYNHIFYAIIGGIIGLTIIIIASVAAIRMREEERCGGTEGYIRSKEGHWES